MTALKILALTHTYPRYPGDTNGPFVEFLMEELAARGHSVRVLTAWDPELQLERPGRRVRLLAFRYAPVDSWHRLGYSRTIEADVRLKRTLLLLAPLLILAGTWRLWREVRRERPDLLHAHWFLPNGCMAGLVSWLTRVPLVSTLHGSDVFVAEKGFPYSLMRRIAVRATDRLTSCSPELRDRICHLGFPRERSHVIPYAADPSLLGPAPTEEVVAAERTRWLAGADGPLLVALGRLVYKKGFDVLLRALPTVCKAHPGLRLVIGGEGDLEQELKTLARESGVEDRVSFAGRLLRDRIAPLMAAADLFVMPSVRDRAGNIDGL
ncbi:MAG: glycosyltransferase, partial [Candidatus Cloacimonetes bacterium]|nr:glycosyltransferase [Candidatus Cloacimonadota bacterium]